MEAFRRPIHPILSRLQGVKRTGAGWQARCPAHADQTPSLSIKEAADGTVLLKCFAGCRVEAIVAQLGLALKDLFPAAETSAPASASVLGSPVAVYSYVDESGALLFQTLRFEAGEHGQRSKTFKQRRPDGQGGWIYNLHGTRRVLYRLPQVLAAGRRHQTIFVVEGEKDVHALEALGLVATNNPMGAGKWQASFSQSLRGADVVLLPDQDVPGFDHMETVARSLYGQAQRIRIVELPDLPPKGDVSDWLARGGTRAALEQLVAEAPAYTPSEMDAADESGAYWPFPVHALPEPVRSFVSEGAKTLGCDASFIALPLLAALAAAIGTTRRIQLKRSWTEPAVLWTAVVSDSGTLKSPALDLALRLLKRRQSEALARYEVAVQAYQDQVLTYEAELAEWKKNRAESRGRIAAETGRAGGGALLLFRYHDGSVGGAAPPGAPRIAGDPG